MTTNSFQGTNSFARPSEAQNIQASQIQDTGLRTLLQDQFKPINSFTNRPAVAPLSQLQSVANQYQGIDRSKMDDATWNFMQPYLSGQMSSVNPTQAFIHRDQLKAAQEAMEAENARRQQTQTQGRDLSGLINDLRSKVDPSLIYSGKGDQIDYYTQRGFIPGQDNGDWRWREGVPSFLAMNMGGNAFGEYVNPAEKEYNEALAEYNRSPIMQGFYPKPELRALTPEEEDAKYNAERIQKLYPKGSGVWQYMKNGKLADAEELRYSPTTGYYLPEDKGLKGPMHKIMPALTMAALGAMTGGAAAAAMAPAGAAAGTGLGLGGSALVGAASALPSSMYTGLNTGDLGKALTGVGLGALGGAAGNVVGPGINSALGIGKDSLLSGLGSGITRAGVSAIGDLARGKGVNWQNALTTLGSALGTGAMGSLANEYLPKDIGGSTLAASALRNVGTGAINGGLNALLKGSSKDILNAAMSGALGGAINSGSSALGGGTIGNAVGNSVLNAYLAAAKRKKASEQG